MRAVVAAHGPASKSVRAYLDALIVTWGTVSDLAQRQEHGAGKEGGSLSWEDGRRLVVGTFHVVYELDIALFGTAATAAG